jgi:all-trans-retinol dehydrogenase (NAD+)
MTTIGTRHALITGGAAGIGRLVAERMAGMGAQITLWDIDQAALDEAVAALRAGGAYARGYVCDVSARDDVAAAAARVRDEAGPVDILVNNAGIVNGRYLLDLTDESIERTFRINVLGLFWVTRAFLGGMIERGSGHVVTVASAAGLIGSRKETDYAASKFAAVGFNEALRMELHRLAPGVRTTVVCPYYIDTGMFAGVKTRFPLLLPILKQEKVADRIVRAVQFNRAQVQMPWMVRTLPAMRLLPVPAFDLLSDFFGVNACMDDFTGRCAAPERIQTPVTAIGPAPEPVAVPVMATAD